MEVIIESSSEIDVDNTSDIEGIFIPNPTSVMHIFTPLRRIQVFSS